MFKTKRDVQRLRMCRHFSIVAVRCEARVRSVRATMHDGRLYMVNQVQLAYCGMQIRLGFGKLTATWIVAIVLSAGATPTHREHRNNKTNVHAMLLAGSHALARSFGK